MAKPNQGRITMTIILLVVIFFLLKYIVGEMARYIHMNEYLLLSLVIAQVVQLIYFSGRSARKLRKERGGEVRYQLYVPPLYQSIGVSCGLTMLCAAHMLFNNHSFTMEMSFGTYVLFCVFIVPCLYQLQHILRHGKDFFRITDDSFNYFRNGVEEKIVFSDVEWVDYVVKRMDIRRGYQKIGIVFRLLSGKEIELNTFRYGFTQEQVTDLMRDIGTRMTGK